MSEKRGWKKIFLSVAVIAAVFLPAAAAVLLPENMAGTIVARASETSEKTAEESFVEASVPGDQVPTFEYQKAQDFVLNIKNISDQDITDITVRPKMREEDNAKWPFKTDDQNYAQKIEKLAKKGEENDSAQVKFRFTEKDDIASARYTLYFEITYTVDGGKKTEEQHFYINTTAKPKEAAAASNPQNTADTTDKTDKKAKKKTGGVSNGGASYSGGGGSEGGGDSGDGSVPRVIVTGFDTNPKKVKAGSDFVLTIHLKNTSRKTRVKNLLFDLTAPQEGDEETSAPAFLPSSGSSSIYLESIKANGTADISISLNAKSDLLQKPYSVDLNMKYEDASNNAVEATSSVSIPVKQDARFEFSDFEISPESIAVGEEANVMCSLYNLGRIKLYNVKATFEGAGIEKEQVFVGNVESGATASIDAMIEGVQAAVEPVTVTMTMSYEDEEGEVFTEEKQFSLAVTEQQEEPMDVPAMEEETKSGPPIVPIVGGIAVLAAVAAAVVILKRRKKKKAMDEEEELLYELDGSSEDEQQ